MTISAKVIVASRSQAVPPIVTMELRYPRFIHAEFMTHRVFSRNASSSRAVPVKKMIQDVIDDPAMPVRWGANQPGMQDAGEHHALVPIIRYDDRGAYTEKVSALDAWLEARDHAVGIARSFADAEYHKQVVNRLLEPFAHITVIVTATDWKNFFDLRCHPAADPTMRALAEAMRDAHNAMTPHDLGPGEWHLPYITDGDVRWVSARCDENPGASEVDLLTMISAARCARVSYLNHDGSAPDIAKDLALADRLAADRHMSPFEHQATPDVRNHQFGWEQPKMHGNLTGWIQWRKHLEKNL